MHVLATKMSDRAVRRMEVGLIGHFHIGRRVGAGQLRGATPNHFAREIQDFLVSLALLRHSRHHQRGVVTQRQVEPRPHVDAMELTGGHVGIAGRCRGRGMLGNDIEGACQRITTKQRALGTTQDLDVIDVEQIEVGCKEQRVVDVVNVERDRRLAAEAGIGRTDAANERRHAWSKGALYFAELCVGDDGGQVRHVGNTPLLESFGGHGSDGDGRALQVRRHTRRSDDDVREALLRRLLSARGLGLSLHLQGGGQ